ncbi:immunoglobulin superfamily member 1-like isoform X2 [Macrotis lagotis]|uniref:immunoglobulin superfamily member 1-like isoform X2 n=1 Tax=Macrotis lagotis TaxID=92651 RepID=UPI003D687A7D
MTDDGLCLNWVIGKQLETLPRPTLWAVPSPVVTKGMDVTFSCQGHLGTDRFQLWMGGEIREERNASWGLAEFVFKNVDDMRDARSYSCRSGQGSFWSEPSDPLTLVVTGLLPKPTAGISPGYEMTPGSTVTISCQISSQVPLQEYNFALLEATNLEPLETKSPGGTKAVFSFLSVRAEDTGGYRCIYYKKTAPHRGSHPSLIVHLTVNGKLPKPSLWAQSGLMISQGANITLWCSRPKQSSFEEVTFILRKAETQQPLEHQTSADPWTGFLLPSVRPEDTGSYSCAYRERSSGGESEPSDILDLVVPGSLPRPSLIALPGLLVEPGIHVTLRCRLPPQTSFSDVTFSLLKVGSPLPLQSQSPAGTFAEFPLFSVRSQDAGNYSCVYHGRMVQHLVSETSNTLEIWVTDALPRPSLLSRPGSEMASGADVTLLCQGPSWAIRFLLYKEGDGKNLRSMDTIQDGAQFFLTHVTPQDSGNYICSYQFSNNGSLWTQHSDPLQIIVRGSVLGITLIVILSCVSFLLLCLLLLVCLRQGCISKGSLQGESHSIEMAKKRSRKPLVSIAEESQVLCYAQLNLQTLNNRKSNSMKEHPEPSFYATVSGN